jgi:hypothetical protein
VGEVDLGLDFVSFACGTRRPGWSSLSSGAEMRPHFICFVVFKRTGMGFLFGDTNFRQDVKNRLALDLQFSRQIVNSNLTHPPFLLPPPLLKSS